MYNQFNLDCRADMRVDVSSQHGLFDLEDLSLDDNVFDATHKRDSIGVEGLQPAKKVGN